MDTRHRRVTFLHRTDLTLAAAPNPEPRPLLLHFVSAPDVQQSQLEAGRRWGAGRLLPAGGGRRGIHWSGLRREFRRVHGYGSVGGRNGGLSFDDSRWVACKAGFFLPVKVLSRVFRGKLLSKLEQAVARGTVRNQDGQARQFLKQAARKDWVVYAKRPFGGPEQVLGYLARYTHRIAISNSRLVAMPEDRVTFRWRDRARNNKPKLMTLDAREFLRRFLLHVLPKGLVRIRHYGLLANKNRRANIRRCRRLLGVRQDTVAERSDPPVPWQELLLRLSGFDPSRCPQCDQGRLIHTRRVGPVRGSLIIHLAARPP